MQSLIQFALKDSGILNKFIIEGVKMKKRLIIGLTIGAVLVTGGYISYNLIINPKDIYGEKCSTFYNQNSYLLKNAQTIDIPKNSCFVNECCSYVARFRSKESYDKLEKELKELEKALNEKYTNMHFKIKISNERFYRSYSIEYNYR